MNYTEYKVSVKPVEPWFEVLVSMVEGYCEGFQVERDHILLYTEGSQNSEEIESAFNQIRLNADFFSVETNELPAQNWNQEWESQYDPVLVDGFCVIKAPFHTEEFNLPVEVLIQPQMSFGTGHHQTTYLMAKVLEEFDVNGKDVLDMGCGTGVLGILACKLQAKSVKGIDVEENAVENAKENVLLNAVEMEVVLGSKERIKEDAFDLVLANINKNILLDQMESYFGALRGQGDLFISGFMSEDKNDLMSFAREKGFDYINSIERENWICMHLRK